MTEAPPVEAPRDFAEEAKAWAEATELQRASWLSQPAFFGLTRPQGDQRPGDLFLAVLRTVLKPVEAAA